MPKVSVVIPVYGVEKYIERCARYLFEQTLDDIEYLFIDDCTPDKSIEVLKRVLEDYPHRKGQVIIHRMEQNSGQAKVREWGMRNATGEFLIHCDSDDWPEKQQYEKMYNVAITESADLVFCDYYRVFPNGKKVYNSKNIFLKDKNDLVHRMLIGYHDINQLWSCLMRRELIQNIVYPEGNQGEDRVIMFQVINESKHISYLREALYNYFINPESIQRTIKPGKLIERAVHYAANVELILSFLKRYNNIELYEEQMIFSKFEPRVILSTGLYDKHCRDVWKQIFPEINGKILKNKYIPILSKFKEMLMQMHLGAIYGYTYYLIRKVL